jgi:hypothetical protein
MFFWEGDRLRRLVYDQCSCDSLPAGALRRHRIRLACVVDVELRVPMLRCRLGGGHGAGAGV